MKKESDIDNLISKRLKERIESLPEQQYVGGAWESFKAANAVNIKRESRLRTTRLFTYSTIGVAALLLIGLFLFNRGSQDFLPSNYQLKSSIATIENRISVIESPTLSINKPSLKIKSLKSITRKSTRKIEESSLLAQQKENQSETVLNEETFNKTLKEFQKEDVNSETSETTANEQENIAVQTVKKHEKNGESNRLFEGDNMSAKRKLLHFGVNISPGFNSSPLNSGGTFNYSGGLSLDIVIAKNLEISTGVQIEHQNVVGENKTATKEVLPGHVDALLTNLDIPINIKWSFYSDNSKKYYVSGGLSSLAYLNEKYTTTSYSHTIQSNTVSLSASEKRTTYKVENVETVKTTTPSPSNAFDVAGRVNIILGYEQRLSPKLNLHIEPFIKIPLSGLATENMRFTTGGVTFKVSF